MSATIEAIIAEAKQLEYQPIPAEQALRELCQAVPSKVWRKRCKGWGRTHYADCNANGTSSYRFSPDLGLLIDEPEIQQIGGQNEGEYEVGESGLWLSSCGDLYEVKSVDGNWSNLQGSSSGYELLWGRYCGHFNLNEVADVVRIAVEKYRDKLRSRHECGAGEASKLLAALASLKEKS